MVEIGRIVLVEPDKLARVEEIEFSLDKMQSIVGGPIQAIYPFDDNACLVCNDEGKINGLPLNRALVDTDGNVIDIIAGTFFICRMGEEDFTGLTNRQLNTYRKKYHLPERLLPVERNGETFYMMLPYEP